MVVRAVLAVTTEDADFSEDGALGVAIAWAYD
jgi:hypothetical protein